MERRETPRPGLAVFGAVLVVIVLVTAPVGLGWAQSTPGAAAPAAAPHSAALLREHVVGELLREGVSLKRLGLEMAIRRAGADSWSVTLIDASTGQPVQERQIAQLAADRQAAVAQLTVMVGAMVRNWEARKTGAAPSGGTPDPWQTSFPAEALASHHTGPLTRLLVVGAGPASSELGRAAEALRRAYAASKVATEVDSGQSMGDLANLSDGQIVTKAQAIRAQEIVIVRVFGAGQSEAATAVVNIYDAGGNLRIAFSTRAGQPVAKAAGSAEKPAADVRTGVAEETVEAVASLESRNKEQLEAAKKRYDNEFIWFEDIYVNTTAGRETKALQGRHKRPLKGKDLYVVLGRDDLQTRYDKRRALRATIVVAGVALLAGGFIYAVRETSFESKKPFWIGSGLMVIGSGMSIITPNVFRSDPVSPSEARGLADEHNRALRKELGLPDGYRAAPLGYHRSRERRQRRQRRIQLAPVISDKGAGLFAVGRF